MRHLPVARARYRRHAPQSTAPAPAARRKKVQVRRIGPRLSLQVLVGPELLETAQPHARAHHRPEPRVEGAMARQVEPPHQRAAHRAGLVRHLGAGVEDALPRAMVVLLHRAPRVEGWPVGVRVLQVGQDANRGDVGHLRHDAGVAGTENRQEEPHPKELPQNHEDDKVGRHERRIGVENVVHDVAPALGEEHLRAVRSGLTAPSY